MSFSLRPYQQQGIEGIQESFKNGLRRVLFRLPTGGGKTACMAFMADRAQKRGKRVWFLVHRRELLKQSSRTFDAMGIQHGFIASGMSRTRHAITIAMVGTVSNRLEEYRNNPPDLIIFDESHHSVSESWSKIPDFFINELGYPSFIVGLTATPTRLDGRGLGDLYDTMVHGPEMRWLIDEGYLLDYDYYAPPVQFSLDGVRTDKDGEFIGSQVAERVNKPSIIGDIVSHWKKHANGISTVAFGVTREHSKQLAAAFNAAGIPAMHVDGSQEFKSTRDQIMQDFAARKFLVLCNVDLVSEGFDVPVCGCVIMAKPTNSLVHFLQSAGRALRVSDEDKALPLPERSRAIILDHVGNINRHGLPDDEREWTLDAKEKRKKNQSAEKAAGIRQCPSCYLAHKPAPTCPRCGHVYAITGRTVQELEGDLAKVDTSRMRVRLEREIQTEEDLKTIAAANGYGPDWVRYMTTSRLPLERIAAQLDAHLKRLETSGYNQVDPQSGLKPLIQANARAGDGDLIKIQYASYQPRVELPKAEALAYLLWLDSGEAGKHFDLRKVQAA